MYSRLRFPGFEPLPYRGTRATDWVSNGESVSGADREASRDINRGRTVALPGESVLSYRIPVMPELGKFPFSEDSKPPSADWDVDPPSWGLWKQVVARQTHSDSSVSDEPRLRLQHRSKRISTTWGQLADLSAYPPPRRAETANYKVMAPSAAMTYENSLNDIRYTLVEGGRTVPWRVFPAK